MVRGKKGFIRIIEAIIAIIIVFGFIVLAIPKNQEEMVETPYDIEQIQEKIINEISNNVTFRRCILNISQPYQEPSNCGKRMILPFITQEAAIGFSFEIRNQTEGEAGLLVKTKEINEIPLNKDVYTKNVVVSVDDVLVKGVPILDSKKRYHKLTLYLWYTV
jgi:hypothetical protein